MESSRKGDKKAAGPPDENYARSEFKFENKYLEEARFVDGDQTDPWSVALGEPEVMHTLVMESVVAAPIREALPRWFLESRAPSAQDLEELGVARTSLDNAREIFASWAQGRSKEAVVAKARANYTRQNKESMMWLEYWVGDEVMLFGRSAEVMVEHWNSPSRSTSLQLGIVKRGATVRVGLVNTADMEIGA